MSYLRKADRRAGSWTDRGPARYDARVSTATSLDRPADFSGRRARYRVVRHPEHERLYHVAVDADVLRAFFAAWAHVDHQNLEYVPYMRFMLAKGLDELAGDGFGDTLRAIVRDRATGGFTIGAEGVTSDPDDFVKLGTAVSATLGPANFDAMSGTYYARFTVEHTDASDSYLRQAYRPLTLHTDGTFVDEPTDWLLMMKFAERNARGGETRLLHLDDWAELARYSEHPLAMRDLTYKAPASKNVSVPMKRRTFFDAGGRPGIRFIDQFVHPETIEEAAYLHDMLASAEADPATRAVPLPAGDLIVLANAFWLHGRAAFEPHPELHRELMRQRGRFSPR
ncbi:MAG: glutarate dioxygenase [Candidatus Eremiobacteraeota bacterium]|nr:glutarate dioxygenase [Candidatus Eremiobacteraeota bacterium]